MHKRQRRAATLHSKAITIAPRQKGVGHHKVLILAVTIALLLLLASMR